MSLVPASMHGRRVLVLNHESQLFAPLTRCLKSAGAEVLTAQSPRAALWYVEGEPLDGAIVFFARQQPAALRVIAAMRNSTVNRRTPVSVIAEATDAEAVKRLVGLDVSNIVLKDVGVDEIVDRVGRSFPPRQRPLASDARLINHVLRAAHEILTFYLQAPVEVGKPQLKRDDAATGFVTASITFTVEEMPGSFSATFARGAIDALAVKALGEAPGSAADSTYADIAGEMSNQILGKAKAGFESLGMRTRMGLPEVLIGDGHTVRHGIENPVLAIPIVAGDSTCVIEFVVGDGVSMETAPTSAGIAGGR